MSPISWVFIAIPAPVVIACINIRVFDSPFFIAHAFNMRAGVNFLPSINTIERRAVIGIHRVKPMIHIFHSPEIFV